MMTPSVESLAALLRAFDCAMFTIIDAEGHPRTRPMHPLQVPFNGHLWFRVGADVAPIAEIGRGANVSVAYGGPSNGPFVAVYGWAMVLRNPAYLRSMWRAAGPRTGDSEVDGQLICVSARAAEVWDAASTASRRIFAFSNAHPVYEQQTAAAQERAFAPRLVATSTSSCAS